MWWSYINFPFQRNKNQVTAKKKSSVSKCSRFFCCYKNFTHKDEFQWSTQDSTCMSSLLVSKKKKKSLSQRTVEIPALTSEASPCLLFFLFLFLLHFLFRHLYPPSLSISTPLISLTHLRIFSLHSPPTQRLPYKKKGGIDRKKRKIWFLNSISLSFLFKYPLSEKKNRPICLHCLLPSPTFSATREFTLHDVTQTMDCFSLGWHVVFVKQFQAVFCSAFDTAMPL